MLALIFAARSRRRQTQEGQQQQGREGALGRHRRGGD
jgi:hypothetical protein